MRQTEVGGITLWAKFVSIKIADIEKLIKRLSVIFSPRNPKTYENIIQQDKKMLDFNFQLDQLKNLVKLYTSGEHLDLKKEINELVLINDQELDKKFRCPLIQIYEQTNDDLQFIFKKLPSLPMQFPW